MACPKGTIYLARVLNRSVSIVVRMNTFDYMSEHCKLKGTMQLSPK